MLERYDEGLHFMIMGARNAASILGPINEGRKAREKALKIKLHPDKWPPIERVMATQAFARLEELLAQEREAGSDRFTVVTKTREYKVQNLVFKGTVGNLYACRFERQMKMKDGLLKISRSPRDNDLIVAEAKSLKKIYQSDNKARVFFPRFEEAFKHRDKTTNIDRQALVVRCLPGFISLSEALACHHGGFDVRDLAWVWRRALIALELLSELGIVHGSVVPEHILIEPCQHGVMLVGMTTSVESGGVVKFLGTTERSIIAPEILVKEPVDTTTDIYMLCATMRAMMENAVPQQFKSFVKGVCFERQKVRPQSPLKLLNELDELLERMYGPRRFRVFPNVGV